MDTGSGSASSGSSSSSGTRKFSEARKAFINAEVARAQLPAGVTMTDRLRAAFAEAAEKRWDEQKLKSSGEHLQKRVLKDNEARLDRQRVCVIIVEAAARLRLWLWFTDQL